MLASTYEPKSLSSFARLSSSYSARYSGLEITEPVQQPPAPRGPHALKLAHKVAVLLPKCCQPTIKFLNLPFILLSKLLDGSFLSLPAVLSKLFEAFLELSLVELSKL